VTAGATRTTFVLVHGNAGSFDTWERVQEALPSTAIALPGFGMMADELHAAVIDSFDLSGFVGWVVNGVSDSDGPFVLAGNGIGSLLCGRAALRLGDAVRGVVMTGPVGLPGGHESLGWLARRRAGATFLRFAGRTFGRGKFLRDQLAHPERDPEAAEILLDALRHARGFHLLARLNRPETLAGLRDLRCPVTVLWGDRDGVLPVTRAEEFMTHLPPHARLEIVPDAGHALPLERPDVVARALRDLE